jgi:hypothetical protein
LETAASDAASRSNSAHVKELTVVLSHVKVSSMEQVPEKGSTHERIFHGLGKSALRLKRPVKNITLNVGHYRFLVLAREIVIEDIMRAVGPVIERVAH